MLAKLIQKLAPLEYDDLRDILHVVDWHRYARRMQAARNAQRNATQKHELRRLQRDEKDWKTRRNRVALLRRGLTSLQVLLDRPPELVAQALELPPAEFEALREAVVGLMAAKRPRPAMKTDDDGNPIARGTWQIKTRELLARGPDGLPVPALDEDGKPVLDENGKRVYEKFLGRYLYLRVHMRTPDYKRRVASIYIGSLNKKDPDRFVLAVQAGIDLEEDGHTDHPNPITREDLIQVFREGGYEAIKVWRSGLND